MKCALCLLALTAAHAAGQSRKPVQDTATCDVPAHPFDLVLARPTLTSVTVSALCDTNTEGFIAYGTRSGELASATPTRLFRNGEPETLVLSPLLPNTQYFYRFHTTDGFPERRPGWSEPIHALLVRYGVTAVFHGHDHFFARQDVDGILYQLVPQPGCPGEGSVRHATEYGYTHGDLRGGSGYLRVTVAPDKLSLEGIRTMP